MSGARANLAAVERMVRALRTAGRLEAVDGGFVTLARSTARSLDAAELGTSAYASCARIHAQAVERLWSLDTAEVDEIDELYRQLVDVDGGAGSVGDPAES